MAFKITTFGFSNRVSTLGFRFFKYGLLPVLIVELYLGSDCLASAALLLSRQDLKLCLGLLLSWFLPFLRAIVFREGRENIITRISAILCFYLIYLLPSILRFCVRIIYFCAHLSITMCLCKTIRLTLLILVFELQAKTWQNSPRVP